MTTEQRNNLELACQDLEANEEKAIGEMRCLGARCCLAVMADTACKIKHLSKGMMDYDRHYPSAKLSEIFGLPNSSILESQFNFSIGEFYASNHNDGNGTEEKTHKEIAAMIRQQYLSDEQVPTT